MGKAIDLLNKFENTTDVEEGKKIFVELMTTPPFDFIMNKLNELQTTVESIEEENIALKSMVKAHAHVNGKVLVEIKGE